MSAPFLLFLKARLPGAADLFAMPVQVGGHTTKEGTYVAPFQAIRHKRTLVTPVPAAMSHPDLFAPKPAPAKAKPAAPSHPDLFAAPPAAAAAPAPAPAAPAVVPLQVKAAVGRALESLREVEFGIVSAREGDRMFDGRGRYEHEGAANLAAQRSQAESVVAKFRTAAGKMGVDADATIAELGGLPDLTPSPAAVAWAAAGSSPPAPAPKEEVEAPEPTEPVAFGVPAGTEKADRLAMNRQARDLLASKSDADMLAADRAVLAKYTGTGTIGDSANEFYTPPAVASAMWSLLAAAGFKGGDVLEPSAGTGVFAHTMPAGVHLTTVEMDPTSSRICGILHPAADNRTDSLERFATQDGRQFDAIIGNPPFGARGDSVRDDKKDMPKAEAYFLDTALDKLHGGGLCAFVVPSGVMDASSNRGLREAILRKAEFLGATRLPNTAFEAAHTQVTTDVVLFRKRPMDVAGALGTLTPDQAAKLGVVDEEFASGSYFAGRGAGNINGTLEPGWREKAGMGHDITVSGSMVGVPEAVAAMPLETPPPGPDMHAILDLLDDDDRARSRALGAALRSPYLVAKPGDVKTVDGVRYILQGEPPRWHLAELDVHPSVHDALRIAGTLADLEGPVEQDRAGILRAGLIEDLDAHVAAHGIPARNKHLRNWLAAPSMPNTDGAGPGEHAQRVHDAAQRAARLLGAVNADGTYSDLVTGNERRGLVADLDTTALQLSLEMGGFTAGQLADRAGTTAAATEDHLFASPAYALDPDGQTWHTMDAYTSGEMWPKLDAARAAAADATDPALQARWTRQADALEAAIAPQSLEDVEIALSSGFVGADDITAFFKAKRDEWKAANPNSQYGEPGAPIFDYSEDGAIWTAENLGYGDGNLVLEYLNRTGVKKVDQPRLERIQAEFGTWLLGSSRRDAVEERYNRTYRGFRAPAYSDAPIDVPGLNPAMRINAFHFSGLRWALEAGSGIVAADVGLGKTIRGLMLNSLLRGTGTAKKPAIVVPKSVLGGWVQTIDTFFPGARTLVIGETYKRDKAGNLKSRADTAKDKQEKYHQLQQNDYDFVLISQTAWNDLDVSPERKADMQDGEFWNKRRDSLDGASSKKVAQAKIRHDQDMATRDFKDREATIYFDDLGIDTVILDEGHAYKNLYAAKKRFGESPKFLGGSGQSIRAQDTYFKSRVIREANDGRGVFMLTATPTKNSPLEVYSMLSHIAPEAFERMGIRNSEAFLDRFCEFEERLIMNPKGEMEEALVTAGFKNLGELREVMRRYIDRKTAADVGLVIPNGEPHDHYVDMTPAQEMAYAGLRDQFGSTGKAAAHVFSIMSDMGKASIDLSLLTGGSSLNDMPKVDKCVEVAVKGAEEGGQLLFCDHVDMHERIAAKLVAAGVPRTQIAILNASAAPSASDRQRICDRYNRGDIRYVIGNTPTMGEGVNLQVGTTDIHHLDLCWEPASMQQRNGRGVRQGNIKEAVRLHSYLAKKSFDGYRLQTIRAKKDWQDLLWNGGDRVENLASQGIFSPVEQMIMMAADPDAARAKYEGDVAAATGRKVAADRGAAIDAFNRLGRMTHSLAKLRADVPPGAAVPVALQRLEAKQAQAREALAAMPGFTHKDLLDSPVPMVIQPVTNHAWGAGRGMLVDGGPDSPIRVGTEPTRWVVTEADPNDNTVTVRPYGTYNTSKVTMKLDDLKGGVVPFDASDEHEGKLLDQASVTPVGREGQTMKLHELRSLPDAILRGRRTQVEARMRHSITTHEDTTASRGTRTEYGMIGPDGRPHIVSSYSMAGQGPEHRLMLPLPEHKEAAIRGYVTEGLGRTFTTDYGDTGGRSSHFRNKENGIKPVYAGGAHDAKENPWKGVLSDLFGPKAHTEAKAALHTAVLDGIKAAPDFRAAVVAAQAEYDHKPRYGAAVRTTRWPRDVVQHLAARAKQLGTLDHRMAQSMKHPGGGLGRDLHPDLLRTGGTNYGQESYYGGASPTIRQFLAAVAHPDDAKSIKEWGRG